MIPLKSTARRKAIKSSHVCLSCRLKSHKGVFDRPAIVNAEDVFSSSPTIEEARYRHPQGASQTVFRRVVKETTPRYPASVSARSASVRSDLVNRWQVVKPKPRILKYSRDIRIPERRYLGVSGPIRKYAGRQNLVRLNETLDFDGLLDVLGERQQKGTRQEKKASVATADEETQSVYRPFAPRSDGRNGGAFLVERDVHSNALNESPADEETQSVYRPFAPQSDGHNGGAFLVERDVHSNALNESPAEDEGPAQDTKTHPSSQHHDIEVRGTQEKDEGPPQHVNKVHQPLEQRQLWAQRAFVPLTSLIQTTFATSDNHPQNALQFGVRRFHTAPRKVQEAAVNPEAAFDPNEAPYPPFGSSVKTNKFSPIRQELRQWQELNASADDTKPQPNFDVDESAPYEVMNSLTRLPDASVSQRQQPGEEDQETGDAQMSTDARDGMVEEGTGNLDSLYVNIGDLVELELGDSERDSILAVFVRRLPNNPIAQFFTMQGRWVFVSQKNILWSIPRWISQEQVEPLLNYIPAPSSVSEIEELRTLAYAEDLSVPRSISAPLVTKLVKFWTESQEIYRKHARVLDDAHNRIAHETDLRYGSLVSATENLLGIPKKEMPATAIFAVRTALRRAGFGFNIDRRSHRMTGYLQIRSKEQVRMVKYVRDWMRDWQDDLAKRSQMAADGNTTALRKHKTSKRASYIYSFIDKARKIVLKSRENRSLPPEGVGNIGISRTRFPITENSQSVQVSEDDQFNAQDTEIVRFIEAWCCSGMFTSLPTFLSLPPMILQATGLYSDYRMMDVSVGFTFLQELGTLMPYENRTRFDQHLLLPSSQHSKPLQNLMNSLIEMQHNCHFTDSMANLRKSWGSLPVYCIDDVGAQEIDDGISIQRIEGKDDEFWLHTHVANPTAFFERDHALAKMARHMGESIYMPERSYMMLPRWATSKHFSLAPNRPCLTFSTRVDTEGNVQEVKVTSGIIENVIPLAPRELSAMLGEHEEADDQLVLTVGGEPPQEKLRTSQVDKVSDEMLQDLKMMRSLTDKLAHIRTHVRGGMSVETSDNDVEVWQSTKGRGLAWDQPYRKGSRTVEGDPVIQFKTRGYRNWFDARLSPGTSVVREMMLLAGESAAKWCSERGIPTIYRGSVPTPGAEDPDKYYRDVIEPAIKKTGEIPPHLGVQYFQLLGRTVLMPKPIPHKVAGLEMYAKTTSPLRRYGDMIVHWQIEAALREEAKRGRKLTPKDIAQSPSILPFSTRVLETIMLGIQPRESLITASKRRSREFWMNMLFFRAYHYGECELPFAANQAEHEATGKPLLRLYISNATQSQRDIVGVITALNTNGTMVHPERFGLEPTKVGDVWEVELNHVDVYKKVLNVKPLRLAERPEE